MSLDRLRLSRHAIAVFVRDVVRGDRNHRKRFLDRALRWTLVSRLTRSASQTFLFLIWRCTSLKAWKLKTAYPRWAQAVAGLQNRDYLLGWLVDPFTAGPRILVLGRGSIGDVLQMTPLLRSLRNLFPEGRLCVLHQSPHAGAILGRNPNVSSVATATTLEFEQATQAVQNEGAADLVVSVLSVSYCVAYFRAPASLRHPGLNTILDDHFFSCAETRQKELERFAAAFPSTEQAYLWPSNSKEFHYLDVLGASSNLPINRDSELEFYAETTADPLRNIVPDSADLVTVNSGVDADVMLWGRSMKRRPTKLVPLEIWEETIQLLTKAGLTVVQLGSTDDDLIEGVSYDLRGTTNLSEAANLMKRALCHIGPEGGLIHLARAVNTKCVTLFGPTPAAYLGYSQNVNLTATECTGCWWTTPTWFIACPVGHKVARCMSSFSPAMIANAAISIAHRSPS